MSDMSMADVLALQNRGDSMGTGGSSWLWWVLLIFLLGGGGFGMNSSAQQGITNDFLFSNLSSGIAGNATRVNAIGDGIASATYDLSSTLGQLKYENAMGQNNIQQSINGIGSQVQQGFCQTNYNMQSGFNNLNNSMNMGFMQMAQTSCDNTQRIIDLINTNTTQALRDKLNEYQIASSNATQSAYLISQLKTST